MTDASQIVPPPCTATRPAPSAASFATAYERYDRMFAGFERAMLDAAHLRPGMRVLDVGCGAGTTSLHAARIVSPGGQVVGVDHAPATLAVAQARGQASGLPVTFTCADAAQHPWSEPAAAGAAAGPFDAILSRFGNLHFADPVTGHRNLYAALRPGARLWFVCARDPARNHWASVPQAALSALWPRPAGAAVRQHATPATAPNRSGPFVLSDPARVHAVLTGAGFRQVQLSSLDWELYVGRDVQDAVAFFFAANGGQVQGLVRSVGRPAVEAALQTALRPYEQLSGVWMPGSAWMVNATRPVA